MDKDSVPLSSFTSALGLENTWPALCSEHASTWRPLEQYCAVGCSRPLAPANVLDSGCLTKVWCARRLLGLFQYMDGAFISDNSPVYKYQHAQAADSHYYSTKSAPSMRSAYDRVVG
ncbi:hypothetical protein J1614_001808 [Plenodomus biglobosus]|nr:hypothetical protein J1614_001808 [Plenodomus biglobosus]